MLLRGQKHLHGRSRHCLGHPWHHNTPIPTSETRLNQKKRFVIVSSRAGPFFVTKTLFYCRCSNRRWFSPLDSQPLLPGRAVRQDGPPQIGPETVGWTSTRTEAPQTEALGLRRSVLKNTDIFLWHFQQSFTLTVKEISLSSSLSLILNCVALNGPRVRWERSDFNSMSSESTAQRTSSSRRFAPSSAGSNLSLLYYRRQV